MDINSLRKIAADLGFSFERGSKKGAGYVLVDGSGEKPLGVDYNASLADVERYLTGYVDDVDADIQPGSDEAPKPALTPAEIRKSLTGHDNADKIKSVLTPPSSTKKQQRDRIALDGLMAIGMDVRSAMAFDRLSDAEKEDHFARLRAAREKEERAKAAELPKPKLHFRDFGTAKISPDDPAFQEKVRQRGVFWKAEQQLRRTNIASRNDVHELDTFDNEVRVTMRRPTIKDATEEPQPPELGPDYATPKASSQPSVDAKRVRVPKADMPKALSLLKIATAIRAAVAKNDRAAAGTLLIEAKRVLNAHGEWQHWLERQTSFPNRTARNYMALASAENQNGKGDDIFITK